MNHEIVKEIKRLCSQICSDKLTQLRLEEELLVTLVRNPNQKLAVKTEAFRRIDTINRAQLEMIGRLGIPR